MCRDFRNETRVSHQAAAAAADSAEAVAWVHVLDCSEELFGCEFSVFNSLEQTESSVLDYDLDAHFLRGFPFGSAF